jgi:hypothetical protein
MTIRILAITATALSLGLPAAAQQLTPMEFAVQHFNQDRSPSERIALPRAASGVTVSTRGDSSFARAAEILNVSRDASEQITTGTAFSNTPAYGAEIFERLRAEDDD